MTGHKPLTERIRERTWVIHRWHCKDCQCLEPMREDRERAARELTRPPSGLTRGQDNPGMIEWCQGISASLWDRYEGGS